ncbi:hypothetical protein [Mesomycoplasma molare]|uniref:Tail assembly chaperone n=1 Tax=Mesomycoplasma molare TaxID=171288 RepID=A0ABY5TTR4_9BACT|nr:hypothetical protein [Mesomycoplasma molare]UWD34054.1 hypothetical protein NX772_03030 [Mesomycoplasma molare]
MKIKNIEELIDLETEKVFKVGEKLKFNIQANVRALFSFQNFMKANPEYTQPTPTLSDAADWRLLEIILGEDNVDNFLEKVIYKLPLPQAQLVMHQLIDFWLEETIGQIDTTKAPEEDKKK